MRAGAPFFLLQKLGAKSEKSWRPIGSTYVLELLATCLAAAAASSVNLDPQDLPLFLLLILAAFFVLSGTSISPGPRLRRRPASAAEHAPGQVRALTRAAERPSGD